MVKDAGASSNKIRDSIFWEMIKGIGIFYE